MGAGPRTPAIAPYPWGALDATSIEEARILRDARRAIGGFVRLEAVDRSARDLLDSNVRVHVRRAQPLAQASRAAEALGVVLGTVGDERGPGPEILVEVEPALAFEVAARAIRRTAPRIVDPSATLSPPVAGAFAAVVMAMARRAHAGAPLRIVSVGSAAEVESAWTAEGRDAIAVSLTVLLGDEAYRGRVVAPHELLARAAAPAEGATQYLARLGELPLVMPVVAWASHLALSELAGLRVGDALLMPEWSLARVRDGAAGREAWRGRAWLAPARASDGTRVELSSLGDETRAVLRGPRERLCTAPPEQDMPDSNAPDEDATALADAVGDLPVLVRVEVGEACLSAREWASIGHGDVLPLGRRIGEPVLLRAGGLPIARGELVQIDGEVGVRILERFSPDRAGER